MIRFGSCSCLKPSLYRKHRRGKMDAFMKLFGLWPWECRFCFLKVYRKGRGERGFRSQVLSSPDQVSRNS